MKPNPITRWTFDPTSISLALATLLTSASLSFAAGVPEKCYLFSYFVSNGEDGLHLAWSSDGLKWDALKQGKSFLIFEILGDMPAKELCEERMNRQQQVIRNYFWNGNAYWDNLNFQGEKVGRFWCDSQIWPIAFGFASEQQAAKIFGRIDAEPVTFKGMPLRWCAPIKPGDEDPRYLRGGKYADTKRPELRQYTWFGRLGSGDILARYRTGQHEHAFNLMNKYSKVVSESGTLTECLDMEGKAQKGTSGQGNYLEHAGGLLWCAAKGLFGVDDTFDGTITWNPRIPASIKEASMPFWHLGYCWKFGCTETNYWIDPGKAVEKVRFSIDGKPKELQLDGKGIQFPRTM